ncbi:hypothetical protein [Butyrivibrio sp. FCS014]|uniref:hypothetical protein n=1 Tax=Butyrivibrio sp. FCS014 TaxID=1408304 RepID=UPI000467E0B9|nr:hypothetical protein [Butyrivibrio sp. FCS014]
MKFLIIDDEHELYRVMMEDLFRTRKYSVEEIPRLVLPQSLAFLHKKHYSPKLNNSFEFPFKDIWNRFYSLDKYDFDSKERYLIIFMNGSFRYHFSYNYLQRIKQKHKNVGYVLLLFDNSNYFSAKRAIRFQSLFDYIFSFDQRDCDKYGFIKFEHCFSIPEYAVSNQELSSSCFFAGDTFGRLQASLDVCRYIRKNVDNSCFILTSVPQEYINPEDGIIYNKTIAFKEEILRSYNSDCLLEIVKGGQTGITLRVCEAIAFNKKLLTNNVAIKKEPFYDERFMSVFTSIKDLDIDFIKKKIDVKYNEPDRFSPIRILDMLYEKENERKTALSEWNGET